MSTAHIIIGNDPQFCTGLLDLQDWELADLPHDELVKVAQAVIMVAQEHARREYERGADAGYERASNEFDDDCETCDKKDLEINQLTGRIEELESALRLKQ